MYTLIIRLKYKWNLRYWYACRDLDVSRDCLNIKRSIHVYKTHVYVFTLKCIKMCK